MRTTYMAKPADIEKKWYVVDATDKTLGRLASEIAKVLRGKNKAIYTPHIDTGMLPKNALGRAMMRKLFVYASAEHPHAAQKPEVLEIKY